jgi:trk system potassium uptake protein TrkA
MNILILGAGQVGAATAASLLSAGTNITVVDTDSERLKLLRDQFDLATIEGDAAHPSTLTRAGAGDADIVLAVTGSDQANLVACKLAATLFGTPTRIAAIRERDYLSHPEIFNPENFSVDLAICPEQIVTEYISRLIEYPEALQVVDFAGGLAQLVAVCAVDGGPLVGQELQALRVHMPRVDARMAAIFRAGRALTPDGHTIVEAGDEVFFIAARQHIRAVMCELRRKDKPVRRVMIAGGGDIGSRLAKALEQHHEVKLIELRKPLAKSLASELKHTLVLAGNATDEALLEMESVEAMDIFCAVTNDDESNIMSALLAKRMGAHKVLALVNHRVYANLVQGGPLDIAVSPAQATIGALLTHVRHGDVAMCHSLRRGAAEALEMVVHGDANTSKVVGRRVDEIELPSEAMIVALVRWQEDLGNKARGRRAPEGEVIMAHHDTVIESGDHVIVFVTDMRVMAGVEKLFQVSVTAQ